MMLEPLYSDDFAEAPTKPDIWSPGVLTTGLYEQDPPVGLSWRERACERFLVGLATLLWKLGRVFCRLSARIVTR